MANCTRVATCGSTTVSAVFDVGNVIATVAAWCFLLRLTDEQIAVLSGVVLPSQLSSLSDDDEATSISNNNGGPDVVATVASRVASLAWRGTVMCGGGEWAGSGSTVAVRGGTFRWYKKKDVRPFLFCRYRCDFSLLVGFDIFRSDGEPPMMVYLSYNAGW